MESSSVSYILLLVLSNNIEDLLVSHTAVFIILLGPFFHWFWQLFMYVYGDSVLCVVGPDLHFLSSLTLGGRTDSDEL